jgi:hypothetical protein
VELKDGPGMLQLGGRPLSKEHAGGLLVNSRHTGVQVQGRPRAIGLALQQRRIKTEETNQ